jgi:hypothetical protein
VNLSRETRNRLWRDLLKRSAAMPDSRPSYVTHWLLSALLIVLALYLFAKL